MKIAIAAALFTIFFDFCMNEGNIFAWYYRLIQNLPVWLFKPLGGCIYCFGTWVYIVLFLTRSSIFEYKTLDLVVLFGGMGLTYVIIQLHQKMFNEEPV